MTATAPAGPIEELVEAVRGLQPLFERNRAATEAGRSVLAENVEALDEAGALRLFQPRNVGGPEAGFGAMMRLAPLIAAVCPSTAWILMVFGGHDWATGMFPEAAQREIWGGGAAGLIAGGLANQGAATPVAGGWRVSGRWQFGSGVDHARWFLGGCRLTTSTPERPKGVHVLASIGEVSVDDTWHTLGLRGTGSKDVVLEEVFVPEHRSMATGAFFGGRGEAAQRQATNLYRLPVTTGLAVLAGSVMRGMAEALYDGFVGEKRGQRHRYTGEAKATAPGVQFRVAEAWAEMRSAELLLDGVGAELEALAARGEDPDDRFRVETKWRTIYAVELWRRAAERLYRTAGARAAFDDSFQQQLYRDITMASHHATIDVDGAGEIFGRVELGLEPGSVLI